MTLTPQNQPLITDAMRNEWAAQLAHRAEASVSDEVSLLVFRLGEEHFGLPVHYVEEVISPGIVHAVPHSRAGVLRGITNVRGRIRLCLWMERLLQVNVPPTLLSSRRMLVFDYTGWCFAAEVSEVLGVLSFDPAKLQPMPPTHAGQVYAHGWFDYRGEVVARLHDAEFFNALRRQLL